MDAVATFATTIACVCLLIQHFSVPACAGCVMCVKRKCLRGRASFFCSAVRAAVWPRQRSLPIT